MVYSATIIYILGSIVISMSAWMDPLGLHKYRDALGKPRQGFHAMRIPGLDVAARDTIGTFVIAVLLALIFKWSIWKTVLGAFIIGLLMHALFGVKTKLTVLLGLA